MKCIVIEDEKPAQRLLKNYIEKSNNLDLLAVYGSALEADIEIINSCDLLFLDIKLPQLSGLAFLETLFNKPEVIITTAYPDHAVAAFELEITDYLLKPFSFERFLKAVNRANNLQSKKKMLGDSIRKNIFIYSDKTFFRIEIDEILFIKGEGDYISIHTTSKKWMLNDSLKNWQSKLPTKQFIKVHQSYIINKNRIDKFQGNRVFIAKNEIPVSRSHRNALIESLSDESD